MKKINKIKVKNVAILLGVVLLLIIIIVVAIMLFGGKKVSQEEKLTESLEEMGSDFYENYYYPQIAKSQSDPETFVKKYENMGIKINLENLSRYDTKKNKEKLTEFINKKTKEECDKETTRVIIYPKSPYDKKSYEMKIELVCGFDKK